MESTPHNLMILRSVLAFERELREQLLDEWSRLKDELLNLVRQIRGAESGTELSRAVDQLLDALLAGPARELIRQILASLPPARLERSAVKVQVPALGLEGFRDLETSGSIDAVWATCDEILTRWSSDGTGYYIVPVHYATDRKRTGNREPGLFYSGGRSDTEDLEFGIVNVSIPLDHRLGGLERPNWWRLEFHEDPDRHVVLMNLTVLEEEQFIGSIRKLIGKGSSKEALVFLHGYRVTFRNAARRTAQIAHDLAFRGPVLLYSWPSEGRLFGYKTDENNVDWTVSHFLRFMEMVLRDTGAATVHVIAHSMGNRALVGALRELRIESLPVGSGQLREVILAAPDIDSGTFRQLVHGFRNKARCTLYASSRDRALRVSKRINGYPRAGDTGDDIVIVSGVDTIDATLVSTGLGGHSYVSDERSILSDIFNLFRGSQGPEGRFGLVPITVPQGRYWKFRP